MSVAQSVIGGPRNGVAAVLLPLPSDDSKRQVAAPAGLAPSAPAALTPLRVVDLVTPHLPVVLARIVAGYARVRTPAEFGLRAILDVLRTKEGKTAHLEASLTQALTAFTKSVGDSPRDDPRLQRALDDLSSVAPQLVKIIPDCAALLGVVFHAAERQPPENIPAWPQTVHQLCGLADSQLRSSLACDYDVHKEVIRESLKEIMEGGSQPIAHAHVFRRIHLVTWSPIASPEDKRAFTPKQILESMVPDMHVEGCDEAIRLGGRDGARLCLDPFALIASELVAAHLSPEERADGQQLQLLHKALESTKRIYTPDSPDDWQALSFAMAAVRSRHVSTIAYALAAGADALILPSDDAAPVSCLKKIRELGKEVSDLALLRSCLQRAEKLASDPPRSDPTTSPTTSSFVSHAIEALENELFGEEEYHAHPPQSAQSIELLQCLLDAIALAQSLPENQGLDSKSAPEGRSP